MNRKTLFIVSISELFSKGFVFLFLPISALFLESPSIATLSLVVPVIQSLQNAISFGSNIYLLKHYSDKKSLSGASLFSAFFVFLSFLFFYALVYIFFGKNEFLDIYDVFAALTVTFCLAIFNQYYSIKQVEKNFTKPAYINVVVRFLIYFLSLFFLYISLSALYLYWVFISCAVVVFLSRDFSFSGEVFSGTKRILLFGWPVFFNAIISYASFNLGRLTLYNYITAEEMATIGLSIVFPQACVLLFAIYSRATSPIVMSNDIAASKKRAVIKRNHAKLKVSIVLLFFVCELAVYIFQDVLALISGYNHLIISIGFLSFLVLSYNAAYTDIIFWKERAFFISLNLLLALLFGYFSTYFLVDSIGIYAFPFGIFSSCALQGLITFLISRKIIENEKDNIVI